MNRIIRSLVLALGLVPLLIHSAPQSQAQQLANIPDPIKLIWDQLVPQDGGMEMKALRDLGVVKEVTEEPWFEQSEAAGVVTSFNGKRVEIPGFIVPLKYDDQKVTAFMLAPFVGACIHVPPPPANQLIYIESEAGIAVDDIYEPIYATGVLNTTSVLTDLAEVGYILELETTRPYDGF